MGRKEKPLPGILCKIMEKLVLADVIQCTIAFTKLMLHSHTILFNEIDFFKLLVLVASKHKDLQD